MHFVFASQNSLTEFTFSILLQICFIGGKDQSQTERVAFQY